MKYIIFESKSLGVIPVVFPDFIDHSTIATAITQHTPGFEPASGGFCNINGNTSGKAHSLNLAPSLSDGAFLKSMFEYERT